MSLSPSLSATLAPTRQLRCLLLSSVNISQVQYPANLERPVKDYELFSQTFQTGIVDIKNYQQVRSLGMTIAKRAGLGWALAAAAVRQAKDYDAIIALSDDVGVTAGVLMQFAPYRIPVFVITQNMHGRRPKLLIGKLHLTGAIAKFLCLVTQQVDLLRDQYQVPPDKIALIEYHVDHTFYRPMPEIPAKRQIASAGMTHRDYVTLMRATRDLGVPVKIEAQSAWLDKVVKISPRELHPMVEVGSRGTSAGLRELYAESEIIVVPLEQTPVVAGFSTILEGMAMAKPVIASRIPMIGSFIEDGVDGLLVTPERPDELRAKIRFLLDNPAEARRMAERAHQKVLARYTLDHYTQRIATQITTTLASKPS
ncbi:MAG: glycosyltransferase [Oscillochloridaceae bacterium umkhey_bin13]